MCLCRLFARVLQLTPRCALLAPFGLLGSDCHSSRALSFSFQKSVRNPYVDIFVAIVTVPTLILLALLLDANLQESACCDDPNVNRSSFIVLIFGFGFLVVSLLVCGCIAHKMGFCSWTRPMMRNQISRVPGAARQSAGEGDGDGGRQASELPVFDLPPSYESVVGAQKGDAHAAAVVSISRTVALSLPTSSASMDPYVPPPTYESLCMLKHVNEAGGAAAHHI